MRDTEVTTDLAQENRSILYAWERLRPTRSEDCDKSNACFLHAEDGIREGHGVAGSLAFSYLGLNVYDDFFPNHLSGTFARGQFFICFRD
jgi:hypothetical protein